MDEPHVSFLCCAWRMLKSSGIMSGCQNVYEIGSQAKFALFFVECDLLGSSTLLIRTFGVQRAES